jgi:signal transduction histidine kinase
MRELLEQSLGAGIEVVIEAEPGVIRATIDPERIEQAVMHMALNAAEAMQQSGRLTVSVSVGELPATERRRLLAHLHEEDRHTGALAVLSVADTGCGMPREHVSRIFEPFFTTKDRQENPGLGLATVYNIVYQHGGAIDVETAPGQGSAFHVYLPLLSGPGADGRAGAGKADVEQ